MRLNWVVTIVGRSVTEQLIVGGSGWPNYFFFFFFFFMNGNTERAQCALSLVCIPQEMEKSKTSL